MSTAPSIPWCDTIDFAHYRKEHVTEEQEPISFIQGRLDPESLRAIAQAG